MEFDRAELDAFMNFVIVQIGKLKTAKQIAMGRGVSKENPIWKNLISDLLMYRMLEGKIAEIMVNLSHKEGVKK